MDFSDLDTSLKVTLQNVTLYSNWLYNNREEILRAQNRSNYITSRIGFVESNRGAIISFLKKTGLVTSTLEVSPLACLVAKEELTYRELCLIHLSKESLFLKGVPKVNLVSLLSTFIQQSEKNEYNLNEIRNYDLSFQEIEGNKNSNTRTDYILTLLEGTDLFIHQGRIDDGIVTLTAKAGPILDYFAGRPIVNCEESLNSPSRFDYFGSLEGGIFSILSDQLPKEWIELFPHLTLANLQRIKELYKNSNDMDKADTQEQCIISNNDAREFVWNCVKEFHKEGILKDLFHSDFASKGGNQRDYWVINGCFCSYIIADPSYADEPLEFEGKWICDGFRVDGGAEDVKKFGDVINDIFDGRYKVVIEGDTFKLLKISTLDEPRQQIFFGAPGTGKSFRVEQITKIYGEDVIRTTFHPDSDYSTFVGCYKPTMKEVEVAKANQPILDYDSLVDKFKEYLNVPNANITKACSLFGYNYHDSIVRMQEQGRRVMDLVNDAYKSNTTYDSVVRGGMACYEEGGAISQSNEAEIAYSFVPQAFTQAYTRAWKNQGRPIFLVIEELNRGNCAQIFGDIFQLLDRNEKNVSSYSIIPDRDLQQHLADEFKDVEDIPADIKSGKSMRLPANLYIWATMNTSDQSLFPIDSAFKRRWIWKYIPIANAEKGYTIEVGEKSYDWWTFVDKVNNEIEGATKSEDKKLGYFFAKADNGVISADTFVSKVVFYLWNDVFKDSYDKTIFKNGLTFHRFFEPNGDPKIEVVDQFLQDLGLKAIGEE